MEYLQIFIQAFKRVWFIQLSVLLFFLFSILVLILIVIIILLDNAYRPDVPQYPFNFFLDRFIPLLALFLPLTIVLFLCPFNISWLEGFLLLIFIHCFILIPLFYYWSNLRSWVVLDDSNYLSWNHPSLYRHIAIALVYPAIWGIYLSFSRYLRLGSSVDVSNIITTIDPSWIIILFCFPFFSIWFRLILWSLLDVRDHLWFAVSSLYYSIHLQALQYKLYFSMSEKLFKSYHLLTCKVSLQGPIYFKTSANSLWRRILSKLFYKPKIILFILFCFIILEILITKHLHYSLYALFVYPIIQSFLTLFVILGTSHFVFDVCFSDYLAQRWKSPHYPIVFWDFFEDSMHWFKLELKPSADLTIINAQRVLHSWKLRNVARQVHESQLLARVSSRPKLKTAALYRTLYSVRLMHTEIARTQFHTATAFFARTFMDKTVLANSNWSHIPNIQKTSIPNTFPKSIYINLPENLQRFAEPLILSMLLNLTLPFTLNL